MFPRTRCGLCESCSGARGRRGDRPTLRWASRCPASTRPAPRILWTALVLDEQRGRRRPFEDLASPSTDGAGAVAMLCETVLRRGRALRVREPDQWRLAGGRGRHLDCLHFHARHAAFGQVEVSIEAAVVLDNCAIQRGRARPDPVHEGQAFVPAASSRTLAQYRCEAASAQLGYGPQVASVDDVTSTGQVTDLYAKATERRRLATSGSTSTRAPHHVGTAVKI